MKGVGYMPSKKVKIYEQIQALEIAIKYFRNEKITSGSPGEVSLTVDILEAEKAKLEERLGA